jgi:transcriptional regulator with XRE-family HTH domain
LYRRRAYHQHVRTSDSRSPPPPAPSDHVGALLRGWRSARRVSQLDLALSADVSSRHLSFVETGRAQPSLELVSRLADALEIPLRERNTLLIAAGYAPRYRETGLAAPELSQARRAIEFILKQQEPYPAFVLSRHWDLLMSNRGSKRIFGFLLGGPSAQSNIMRQVFDPSALRPRIVNWEEVAVHLIRHLHNEVAAAPSDARARELLNDVLAYPGVPSRWRTRELGVHTAPLLTSVYRRGDVELRFFSTIATFGTPQDVTLEELRIECSFPADDVTDRFCREPALGRD